MPKKSETEKKKTKTEEKETETEKVEKPAEKEIETEENAEMKEEKAEKPEKAKRERKKKEKKETGEKAEKREEKLLVPLEDYIKAGVHLGTKVITAHMRPYVYKRRADGLAVINTNEIDSRIRTAASFLAQYAPEDILVSCKRESGALALEKFSEITGARVFTKKYHTGVITNTNLPGFFEISVMMIIDPWIDKNPMLDAVQVNIPIIALCDTNNVTSYIDYIVPCNNKSNKSIGLIFWILAREYNKLRGKEVQMPPYETFIGESL
jgi:small subunit ribosomal protein S2